ncbi:alanine racemase [Candidatus Sumerlaeota bacterium]|nr:alanine racemase [Candidatus Sumerlaeota bacterium]
MNRPTRSFVEIDLEAFRHNVRLARNIVGSGVRLMAVVKSNAYGHGMLRCARAALQAGADALGVATTAEALELREHSEFTRIPVLIMAPTTPDEAESIQRADVAVAIGGMELLEAHLKTAAHRGSRARLHIQIDTGIGRDGFRFDDFSWLDRAKDHAPHIEGLFQHFAVADGTGADEIAFTNTQCDRFDAVVARAGTVGLTPLVHAANSGAVLRHPRSHYQMVRPGIMLYGAEPADQPELCPALQPVATLHSEIGSIKVVKAGDTISYGRLYTARKDERVAVIPIGYGDGYPRRFSNQFHVLVRGRHVPIRGRVCMDQIMVDVTDIDGAQIGDDVVLYGRQGNAQIRLEEAAKASGTISYELTCILTQRVPRVYLNEWPGA